MQMEMKSESHTIVDIYDLITVRHFLWQPNFSLSLGNWENLCLYVVCVCQAK